MEIRHLSPPGHARTATTEELRARFLGENADYADVDPVALTEAS